MDTLATSQIRISDEAASRLTEIAAEHKMDDFYVRINVQGQSKVLSVALESTPKERDILVTKGKMKIIFEAKHLGDIIDHEIVFVHGKPKGQIQFRELVSTLPGVAPKKRAKG